jgi:hypothetical protein
MMLARLVVFVLLFALGCGKSQQERALDEIGRRCESFVGIRLGDANRELLRDGAVDRLSPGCDPRLASIGGSTCTESTQENAQCQIFYYWDAGADPACVVRPVGASRNASSASCRTTRTPSRAVMWRTRRSAPAAGWKGSCTPDTWRTDLKAIAIRAHGGPEAVKLVELPDPTPGPGQVVIAVKAAALNHLDIWVRVGWPGLKLAFPHVLGSDVAGVVEAIGPGVEGMKVGDAVVVNPSLGCGRCERCLSGNRTSAGTSSSSGSTSPAARPPGSRCRPGTSAPSRRTSPSRRRPRSRSPS